MISYRQSDLLDAVNNYEMIWYGDKLSDFAKQFYNPVTGMVTNPTTGYVGKDDLSDYSIYYRPEKIAIMLANSVKKSMIGMAVWVDSSMIGRVEGLDDNGNMIINNGLPKKQIADPLKYVININFDTKTITIEKQP